MYQAVFASPRSKSGLSSVVQSLNQWLKAETSFKVAVFYWGAKEDIPLVQDIQKIELDSLEQLHFQRLQALVEEEYYELVKKIAPSVDLLLIDLPLSRELDYLHLIESSDRLFLLNREGPIGSIAEEIALYIQKSKRIKKNNISTLRTKFTADHKVLLYEEGQDSKHLGFVKSVQPESPLHIYQLGEVLYAEVFRKELKQKSHEKIESVTKQLIEQLENSHQDLSELLFIKLNEMDIPFHDKTLLHKYILLRIQLGQSIDEAITDVFNMYQDKFTNELLQQFQQELALNQLRFSSRPQAVTKD